MALKSDWIDGNLMAGNHAPEHNELTVAVGAAASAAAAAQADVDAVEAAVAAVRQVPSPSAGQVGKVLGATGAGAYGWVTKTGPKGEKGDTGDKGDPGTNGTNGADGADGVIARVRKAGGSDFAQPDLEFAGSGVTVAEDAGAHKTVVTVGSSLPDTATHDGNILIVDPTTHAAKWYDSPAFNPAGVTDGYVWTASGGVAAWSAMTVDGSKLTAFTKNGVSGTWFTVSYSPGGTITLPNINQIVLSPIVLTTATTVDRVAVYGTDGASSGRYGRYGLYTTGSNGKPATRLIDSGKITAAASGAAWRGADLSPTVTLQPGCYWVAGVNNTTANTYLAVTTNETHFFDFVLMNAASGSFPASSTVGARGLWVDTGTYNNIDNALPSSLASATFTVSATNERGPALWLRRA